MAFNKWQIRRMNIEHCTAVYEIGSSFVSFKNEIQMRAKRKLCRCARAFIGLNEICTWKTVALD